MKSVLVAAAICLSASTASAQDSVLPSVEGPAAAVVLVPAAFYGLWIATWPVTGFWSDDVIEDDPIALTLSGVGALGLGALAWWATDDQPDAGAAVAFGSMFAYLGGLLSAMIWAGSSALGSDPRGCSSPLCKKLVLGGGVLVPLLAGLVVGIALRDDEAPAPVPTPLRSPPSLAIPF